MNSIPNAATSAPNLAELRPLEQYFDANGKPQKAFNEWLKGQCTSLEEQDAAVWSELHLCWELINHFINGDQLLRRGHRFGGWIKVPLPNNTASPVRQQNKLGFYSKKLMSSWVASRTKVQAVPGDDSDESVGASRAAQAFIDALEPLLYSEDFRQREGLAAQAHGTYARYFYFDADAEDGGYGKKPITEQRQFGGGSSTLECFDCGFVGPAGDPALEPGGIQPATPNAGGNAFQLAPQLGSDLGSAGLPPAAGPGSGSEPALYPENVAPGGLSPFGGVNGATPPIPGMVPPAGLGYPAPPTGAGIPSAMPPVPDGLLGGAMDAGADEQLVAGWNGVCPACASPNTATTPAVSQPIEVVTGEEKYKLGRIKALTVPYSELRHEISQSAEESPWLRWRRRVRNEELKAKFPGFKIENTGERDRDTGLQMAERLQKSLPQSNRGRGRAGDRDNYSDFTQWWFAPCMYSEYVFPSDVETVAGEIIPAGSKASDIFPDGLYVARVDGMDAPIQVRNECHKHHWVTAPYHIRNYTKMGLGINDAVECQRQLNVVSSLVFEQIRTEALGGWLYDKDAIDADDVKLLGQPQNNVPVSTRNREPGTRLEQLVSRMGSGSIPSHLFSYVQFLDANMQTISGALVNQGVPGAEGDTATSATIFNDMAKSHNLPEYAQKGGADVRSMECCIELARKFMPEPRYMVRPGKRGKQDGIWFSGADIVNGQIKLQAVRDTFLPNTRADKQEAIQKLILMFGNVQGFLMAVMAKPDFVESLAQTFGLEIDDLVDTNFQAAVEVSRQRIDQILELTPQYAPMAQQMMMLAEMAPELMMEPGQIDPMTGVQGPPVMLDPMQMLAGDIIGQLMPPIIPEQPAQQVSIEWLRSWLLDDEGKECDDLTRACVQAMIRAHVEMVALEAQVMSGLNMIGNPPPEQGGNAPGQKTEKDKQKDNTKKNTASQARPQPQGAM